MIKIPYKLVLGNLLYEKVCRWLGVITFVVRIVSQHLATHGNAHWSPIKTLLQFMFIFIGFSSQKIPKSDKRKKNHLVNINKSFWPCLVRLGRQIGPCHFDWQSDWQND